MLLLAWFCNVAFCGFILNAFILLPFPLTNMLHQSVKWDFITEQVLSILFTYLLQSLGWQTLYQTVAAEVFSAAPDEADRVKAAAAAA